MGLFFALVLTGGLLSISIIPIRWHVQSHGTPVLVTVTDKHISHSSRHGDTYRVSFDYAFEGQTISDNQDLNLIEYDHADVGETAHGKAARILGVNICLTDLGNVDRVTHGWMIGSAIWNGIFGFVVILGIRNTLRTRGLVVNGVAAPGTITNRRVSRGRSTYWYVSYRFTAANGETLVHERNLPAAGYNSVDIGSPVTVLYQADNPGRSLVYECCNYTVKM